MTVRTTYSRLDLLLSPSLRPPPLSHLSRYEQFLQEEKLLHGEDLEFAYGSISASSSKRDNQDAIFVAEEGVKDICEATLAYKAEAAEWQRQLMQLQSQFDNLTTHFNFGTRETCKSCSYFHCQWAPYNLG